MSPRDEHLLEVLCHCDAGPDGHTLGVLGGPPACAAVVKAGNHGRPQAPSVATRYGGYALRTAKGSCPECGRAGVKVVAHTVRAIGPAERIVGPVGEGIPLGVRPQLAEHRMPGRGAGPCPGAGRVPAETRFTSQPIEAWVRDYGQEHVA